MQYWMISANGKKYDHASAFEKWGFIDWRQNKHKFEVGDIVYIYLTKPYQKIMYRCEIIKTHISYDDIVDDEEFWADKNDYISSLKGEFIRLKLCGQTDNDKLSLYNLQKNGLKAPPQSAIKVNENLKNYIDINMNDNYSEGIFPESDLPEKSYEGALRKVTVNRYERSSVARQKCIEAHGLNCAVCGMNFEEIYGELGKGFIHVHHIVPLNTIGKEYLVDYEKDLIPVCPNCHAMLHRKINGVEPTVDELRKIIKSNKT